MRVFFHTFGCRVNQYETQALRERLLADGASSPVGDFETADLCIVNTCTVTREADKDALRLIRKIARRNPSARLVVTGCLASRAPGEILEAAPAAVVVGNEGKRNLPAMLGCAPAPAAITDFHNRSRAFVKIQDGCNMTCAYCIIPSIRPTLSCKPFAELETEVKGLIDGGYKEIVLCGIRLGRYLVDDSRRRRVDFPALLSRLADLPGDFRIRLSSFEITDVTDRFLDSAVSMGERFCPSFHLPLQSGSESVLKRMERWYSAAFFARRIEALRTRFPGAGLFTDVMVGFPGETNAEFEESFAFVRSLGFSGLHPFRFSKREGTPAARRRDQVPERRIAARAAEMQALDRALRSTFAASAVGSRRKVLAELGKGGAEATTDHFLRVSLDRDPGPGLVEALVDRAEGARARARVL